MNRVKCQTRAHAHTHTHTLYTFNDRARDGLILWVLSFYLAKRARRKMGASDGEATKEIDFN